MTEATLTQVGKVSSSTPTIHYQVAMPQAENHLFEVVLHLSNWQLPVLDLKMPVWTPGSYLVREYAKHLQNFSASAGGQALQWQKLSKNHWQVETGDRGEITVRYRIHANELSVRTNHLNATHGYFNGAAIFFRLPGLERQPIQVEIAPPKPDWHVTTPLPAVSGKTNTFTAIDFDMLVDSPFEIGCHQSHQFEVLGKSHELAIWGKGNADAAKIIPDLKKIIEVEAELFGGLPYDRYLFLLHLASQNNGGLEHKFACSLIYTRFGFRDREKYERFIQLVAHEFFHLWNVKRIRPQALEIFDYDNENYTPSLWFCEGTTSYYDLAIPLRAGIYQDKTYLKNLSKEITRLQTTPGRLVQPASESSFDAWIKLYRHDANSNNSQVSYYLKGELVSLLLDLLIRAKHQNQRSLDDVMRQMWQQFGKDEIGFTPVQLKQVIESVAETKLDDFFKRYIDGTEELPYNDYLEPFGLQLVTENDDNPVPYTGMKVQTENGKETIKFVEIDAPAQQAGIEPGDELLAIDGLKATANNISDRLRDYQPGDAIEVTVFHQEELCTYTMTLAEPRPSRYQIILVENPSSTQKQNYEGWLGSSR